MSELPNVLLQRHIAEQSDPTASITRSEIETLAQEASQAPSIVQARNYRRGFRSRLAKSKGNQDMEQQMVVVIFAALATGGLMVNWIGLGRAMSRLSVSTYVEFHQATNLTFNPYMPIVVVGGLLGGIGLAILSPGIHSLSFELAIAGSLCYVAVLVIALSTDVPINKQIAHWSVQRPPGDWSSIRARWVRFHIVRTLFSLPGLACYIFACLVSR